MKKYQAEAKARWGNTKAYQQSTERTKNWTKKDFNRVAKEGKELTLSLAAVMGQDVDNPAVQSLIARHYQNLQQFYDCSLEMYRNLGKMYVDDPRFTAYYDRVKPGLAQFVYNAIVFFTELQK